MEYIKTEHYDHVRNDYGRELVIPSEKEWAEVKHGKWEHQRIDYEKYHVYGTCSECRERSRINNYCPWCGAKMEDEE